MSKILLNIPHSSTFIPEWAIKDILISKDNVLSLVEFMVDKNVDMLWNFVPEEDKQIAEICRIILDTERYRNDEDEIMSKKGMGLYYTHTPDGELFRTKNVDTYLKCLEVYDQYHLSLEQKVDEKINIFGECLILDCHSFHDGMQHTDYDSKRFPDVCIGINGEPNSYSKKIEEIFKSNGYSVETNKPFAGSLVPLKHLNNNRVNSVMIELNRRIYDNDSFDKICNICQRIYSILK